MKEPRNTGLLALIAVAAFAGAAWAEGPNAGTLLEGGTAKGDISKLEGEEDRISVRLVQGSRLDVTFSSSFAASVTVLDPDGATVDLPLAGGSRRSVKGWLVPRSGQHEFVVRSADGSQGRYKLSVRSKWDRKVSLDGTGETAFDVAMPAGSSLRGVIKAAPGAADPQIVSLSAPDGSPIVGTTVGNAGSVKVPNTICGAEGGYRLVADATGGIGAFRVTLVRKTQRSTNVNLDLENGLSAISFEGAGIDRLFATRCAGCHDWARGYAGVRAYARASYGRMRSGSMPKDAPRIQKDDLAVVAEWIKTGMQR